MLPIGRHLGEVTLNGADDQRMKVLAARYRRIEEHMRVGEKWKRIFDS